MTLARLARPSVCRRCGDATWLADDGEGTHPCCDRWAADLTAGAPCRACEASRAHRRRTRRNDTWEDR